MPFFNNSNREVLFFPRFKNSEDLTNHYYRARWYFPFQKDSFDVVKMFVRGRGVEPLERPEYMCKHDQGGEHICVATASLLGAILSFLARPKLVLVWKDVSPLFWKLADRLKIKAVNVATDDLSSFEYGRYCDSYWNYLLSPSRRDRLIIESYNRFRNVAEIIRRKGLSSACVCGTGPSLETAYRFDFTGLLTLVCNSTVQNRELLDHIDPDFICAGDVVSHIGVSRYAEVFRQDLVKVLKERKDTYFVTSASFGYLLILNHPEIEEKVILIKQSVHNPNYDLHRLFALPYLASTLNIHMLPLAGTFVDKTFIIGCDGKSTNKDNEDFWAHAQKAQYHDLVDTGHKCHPTFDVHRQKSTYDRFINSTEESIKTGESLHGKQYVTLQRSNIPVLSGRKIPTEWLNEQPAGQPVPLRNYSFNEVSASSATPVESTESLPIKVGLDCSIEEGDTLRVRGWVLSLPVVDSVRITVNDVEVGYAIKQARPDVLRANPGYNDSSAGFLFLMGLEGQKHCSVVIDFIIENDVVHTMRKNLG